VFQKSCTRFVDAGGIPVEVIYDESSIPAQDAKISMPQF
jgi:replicative DNA helicase